MIVQEAGILFAISCEERVELRIGNQTGKAVERAILGDLGRGADKGVHGDAGERPADADPAKCNFDMI